MTAFSLVLVCLGMLVLGLGSLGVLRLPDLYSRVHAAGMSDTLGISLLCLGLALHHGWSIDSVKLALIPVFLWLANPVATHAVVHAAWHRGLKPWTLESKPGHEESQL
ncbi:MAG: monovalent cation/H(+) antiporter subunit G [Candidatus Omnitrophica bacterium]|nr:monovalent cation/H(+) antiporter subunit G [Candidatus Omnitrophota bacterium]